jgi:hypothetical protein
MPRGLRIRGLLWRWLLRALRGRGDVSSRLWWRRVTVRRLDLHVERVALVSSGLLLGWRRGCRHDGLIPTAAAPFGRRRGPGELAAHRAPARGHRRSPAFGSAFSGWTNSLYGMWACLRNARHRN